MTCWARLQELCCLRRAVGVMKPLSIRSGSGGSQLNGCRPVSLTSRGCRGTHLSGVAASLLSISVADSCRPQVGSLGVTFSTLSSFFDSSLSVYCVCRTSMLVLVLKGTRLAKSEAESPLKACKAGICITSVQRSRNRSPIKLCLKKLPYEDRRVVSLASTNE